MPSERVLAAVKPSLSTGKEADLTTVFRAELDSSSWAVSADCFSLLKYLYQAV